MSEGLLELLIYIAAAVHDSCNFDVANERSVIDNVRWIAHRKTANPAAILGSAPTYERIIGDQQKYVPKA